MADMSYLEKLKGLQKGSKANESYGIEDSVQKAFSGQTPKVKPMVDTSNDSQLALNAERNAEMRKAVMSKLIQEEQQKTLANEIAAKKPGPEFDEQAYRQKDAELKALMGEFTKTKKLLGK